MWKPIRPWCLKPDTLSCEIARLKPVSFYVLCCLFLAASVFSFTLKRSSHFAFSSSARTLSSSCCRISPSAPCILIRLVEVRAVSRSCVILSGAVSSLLQKHDWPVNACWVENNLEAFSCENTDTLTVSVLFTVNHFVLFHINSIKGHTSFMPMYFCCFSWIALMRWTQVKVIIFSLSFSWLPCLHQSWMRRKKNKMSL